MNKSSRRIRLCAGVSLSALILALGTSGTANAQAATEAQVQALLARIDQLERTVNDLKKGQAQTNVEAKTALKQSNQAKAEAARAQARVVEVDQNGHTYLEHKRGNPLTFYTPGGEITAYGNFDVSFDDTSKDVKRLQLNGNSPPIGNFGWMPAISTNLSYLGVRGFQRVGDQPFNFVYQNSTAMFNPFNGMLGDYAVIMGNTGGDNRVEFGTRVAHAIWYESPTVGGWQFNALFSPGQNRSTISDNIPSGESDCAGGNDPTSGGFTNCSDGSFRNLVSANLTYKNGPLLVTGAYEWHQAVNRMSDLTGASAAFFNADIGNEWAAKIGALYTFETKTTIGGIFEWMRRDIPAFLAFQNERSRNGTWLFVSQQLTDADSIHFGWAHAFRAQGDPGQHNDATLPFPDASGLAFAPNQNQADMVTAAYKHQFSPNLQWYVDAAATFNGPSAHFDLGAGGRAVTTDCHDAQDMPASGGAGASPHCFTGTTVVGVSTGMKWTF
jgi:predicted porin